MWLRLDGIDWSLPYRLHPDEWKYVSGGAGVFEGNWNPKYFRNPPGFSYANTLWYPLWLRIAPTIDVRDSWEFPPSTDVAQTLRTRPYDLMLGTRVLSALFGVGVVLLAVLIARRLHSWSAAWCAGTYLMVSFVSVRESHMGTNDTASVFWVMLAFFVGMIAQKRKNLLYWMLAGGLAGVAIATKYNTFPIVFALFVLAGALSTKAHLLTEDGQRIGAMLGMVFIGFLLVCPFPIIDSITFTEEIRKLRDAANAHWPGQDTTLSIVQLIQSLVMSEGWAVCLFALIGGGFLFRSSQYCVLVFPLAYALLIFFHPLYFVRFALPMLPFVVIFAAVGLVHTVNRLLVSERLRIAILVGVCILTSIEPLSKTLRSNWLFHQKDTRIEALEWLWERANEQVLVVGDQYVLPIPYRTGVPPWGVPVDPRFQAIDALAREQFGLMEGAQPAVRYVGVSTFASFPGQHEDPYLDRRMALKQFAGGEDAVVTFQPFSGEWTPEAAHIEDTYHPTTRLWDREQPGPAIEFFLRQKP